MTWDNLSYKSYLNFVNGLCNKMSEDKLMTL